MSAERFSGRCLCGDVRYACGPPLLPATLCHCESCRRASGAHALGWLTVARSTFEWTAGVPRRFASSPGVERSFCARCGTPLSYQRDSFGDEIDLTVGSFEAAARFAPVDHIWMQDALDWDRPGEGLPCHPARRPSPQG